MTKIFLISLTFLPIILFGQEVKKKVVGDRKSVYKEIFYVLKSNETVKHGSYKKLNSQKVVLLDGFYKQGLKDSVWTELNWNGNKKVSQGSYSKELKVGVWEYFNFKGELEQKFDYDKKEIVYFKIDEKEIDKEVNVIKGNDTIKLKLDRPPLYIGGSAMISEIIASNIIYPSSAIENGIQGKIYLAFTIDENGKTSDHRVIKGIDSECDQEALRVVKKIADNWIPAISGGQKVKVEYSFPINFTLQ